MALSSLFYGINEQGLGLSGSGAIPPGVSDLKWKCPKRNKLSS